MSMRKWQILIFIIISLIGSYPAIAHGVFFDGDFSQWKRVSFIGWAMTSFVIFIAILLLEKTFDWNNNEKIKIIKQELQSEIEKRDKKIKILESNITELEKNILEISNK